MTEKKPALFKIGEAREVNLQRVNAPNTQTLLDAKKLDTLHVADVSTGHSAKPFWRELWVQVAASLIVAAILGLAAYGSNTFGFSTWATSLFSNPDVAATEQSESNAI